MGQLSSPQTFTDVRLKELSWNPSNAMQLGHRVWVDQSPLVRDCGRRDDRRDVMKLYDSVRAPNPRRVRIFLAEKGIEVPKVMVDLAAFEHRSDEFTKLNPLRRTPALELDDGTVITESVAISRYFEELYPEPSLFGRTPVEKATIEMWNRRVELGLMTEVQMVFRHGHPGMATHEIPQVQDWAEANKPKMMASLRLINDRLGEVPFIAGMTYSVADITLLCAVDFMKPTKIKVPEELAHVRRWYEVMNARPSAKA